ncbi:hypothetical protein EYF80_050449 [Liparis tanakae]|uniref:Uncharacterized protein n=1 Tax=Liparis tanakae TaxID=230148 RepID=A0A4Z2FEI0_9TELE|nr:hypothetical protein EYF80_050449 [Liparis tanakae]
MSDEFQRCVSRRLPVPEHQPGVGSVVAAEHLHRDPGFCDDVRGRLTDVKAQTSTWTKDTPRPPGPLVALCVAGAAGAAEAGVVRVGAQAGVDYQLAVGELRLVRAFRRQIGT